MPEPLSPRQRQTQAGRQALAAQFPDSEAKSQHYRALGRRSAERRFVLSADERAALVSAYELLARIAERARLSIGEIQKQESAA